MKKQNSYTLSELLRLRKLPKHFENMIGYVHFQNGEKDRIIFRFLYPYKKNSDGMLIINIEQYFYSKFAYYFSPKSPIAKISIDTDRMLLQEILPNPKYDPDYYYYTYKLRIPSRN